MFESSEWVNTRFLIQATWWIAWDHREVGRDFFCVCNHGPGEVIQSSIGMFRDTILLWCVHICELAFDTIIGQICAEYIWSILAATICVQDFKDFSSLFLHTCLPLFEDGKGIIFGLAESYMSVMTEVISESDEVLISLYGGILNWTTDVAEDSSEYFGCPILSCTRYHTPCLFPFVASRASFTSAPNYLNASDSIGSHHLLYGVLAYVTELMVPKG